MNITPSFGWGWWIAMHIIIIPLLLIWGASIRNGEEIKK